MSSPSGMGQNYLSEDESWQVPLHLEKQTQKLFHIYDSEGRQKHECVLRTMETEESSTLKQLSEGLVRGKT